MQSHGILPWSHGIRAPRAPVPTQRTGSQQLNSLDWGFLVGWLAVSDGQWWTVNCCWLDWKRVATAKPWLSGLNWHKSFIIWLRLQLVYQTIRNWCGQSSKSLCTAREWELNDDLKRNFALSMKMIVHTSLQIRYGWKYWKIFKQTVVELGRSVVYIVVDLI